MHCTDKLNSHEIPISSADISTNGRTWIHQNMMEMELKWMQFDESAPRKSRKLKFGWNGYNTWTKKNYFTKKNESKQQRQIRSYTFYCFSFCFVVNATVPMTVEDWAQQLLTVEKNCVKYLYICSFFQLLLLLLLYIPTIFGCVLSCSQLIQTQPCRQHHISNITCRQQDIEKKKTDKNATISVCWSWSETTVSCWEWKKQNTNVKLSCVDRHWMDERMYSVMPTEREKHRQPVECVVTWLLSKMASVQWFTQFTSMICDIHGMNVRWRSEFYIFKLCDKSTSVCAEVNK